jgi:hypothetical protein
LAPLAVVCLVLGAVAVLWRPLTLANRLTRLSGLALLGCIVGGLAAVLIVMKSGNALYLASLLGLGTAIGDARVAFVALAAFGIVEVIGGARLLDLSHLRWHWLNFFLWPALFLAVDLYVLCRFLIPLGGL